MCGETARGIHAFQLEHLPATWDPQNLWRNEFNTMKMMEGGRRGGEEEVKHVNQE